MDKSKKCSELIEKIYGAAIDPTLYRGLALDIATYLDAPSAVIQTRSRTTGEVKLLSNTANFTVKSLNDYSDYYYNVDEWVIRGSKIPVGSAFLGSDIVSFREFEEAEIYVDYGRSIGLYDLVGGILQNSNGMFAFGVHRERGAKRFDASSRELAEALLPHIRNSLEISNRFVGMQQFGRVTLEVLNRSALGIVVVDEFMNLKFANNYAEDLLRYSKEMTVRQGKLVVTDISVSKKLSSGVKNACAVFSTLEESSEIFFKHGALQNQIKIKILPVAKSVLGFAGHGQLAVIFIETTSGVKLDSEAALREIYGLTPAEARLGNAIASGESLRDYSERVGVSFETVRTQMKQIFIKTDTNRQAEFILLLSRNSILEV